MKTRKIIGVLLVLPFCLVSVLATAFTAYYEPVVLLLPLGIIGFLLFINITIVGFAMLTTDE